MATELHRARKATAVPDEIVLIHDLIRNNQRFDTERALMSPAEAGTLYRNLHDSLRQACAGAGKVSFDYTGSLNPLQVWHDTGSAIFNGNAATNDAAQRAIAAELAHAFAPDVLPKLRAEDARGEKLVTDRLLRLKGQHDRRELSDARYAAVRQMLNDTKKDNTGKCHGCIAAASNPHERVPLVNAIRAALANTRHNVPEALGSLAQYIHDHRPESDLIGSLQYPAKQYSAKDYYLFVGLYTGSVSNAIIRNAGEAGGNLNIAGNNVNLSWQALRRGEIWSSINYFLNGDPFADVKTLFLSMGIAAGCAVRREFDR